MKNSNVYLGLLSLQILILFMPLLNPGSILFSDQSDLISLMLPIAKDTVADYKNFHITQWNNYLYAGAPLFADFHSFALSPFNLLYYLFDISTAITLRILLHFMIGALAFFYYLKRLGFENYIAYLSSVVFIFSGRFSATLLYPHHIVFLGFLLIPMLLLLIELYLDKKKSIFLLFMPLVLSTMFLETHLQITFYAYIIFIFYFLFREKNKSISEIIKKIFILSIPFILTILLVAVQLLPSLELSLYSTRQGGMSFNEFTHYSLMPVELITLLLPLFFGHIKFNNYWGLSNPWVNFIYFGIFSLFFFILGTFKKNKTRFEKLLLIFIFSFMLFAFGKYNPLMHIAYYLPGFNMFRSPERILFFVAIFFPIVFAYGLKIFLEQKDRKPIIKKILVIISFMGVGIFLFSLLFKKYILILGNRLVEVFYYNNPQSYRVIGHSLDYFKNLVSSVYLTLIISLAVFCTLITLLTLIYIYKHKLNQTTLKIIIALVISIELMGFGMILIDTTNYNSLYPQDDVIKFLKQDNSKFRILDLTNKYHSSLLRVHKIESIEGYNPTILLDYNDYVSAITNRSFISNEYVQMDKIYDRERLNKLNVKYIITKDINYSLYLPNISKIFEANGIFIYYNYEYWPRAVFLGNNSLERIETVDIDNYQNDKIIINYNFLSDGKLILSEVYYPSWKAMIDGNTVEIEKYDGLFRVIDVSSGNHEIKFEYKSKLYEVGKIISFFTLLIVILVCIILLFFFR